MWHLPHQLGAAPLRQSGHLPNTRKRSIPQLSKGFLLERKEWHPSYWVHRGSWSVMCTLDLLVPLYSGPDSFGGGGRSGLLVPEALRRETCMYGWVGLLGNVKLQMPVAGGEEGVPVWAPIPQSCSQPSCFGPHIAMEELLPVSHRPTPRHPCPALRMDAALLRRCVGLVSCYLGAQVWLTLTQPGRETPFL